MCNESAVVRVRVMRHAQCELALLRHPADLDHEGEGLEATSDRGRVRGWLSIALLVNGSGAVNALVPPHQRIGS